MARKFAAAHAKGLIPMLCVGEPLEEREAGRTPKWSRGSSTRCWRCAGPARLEQGVLAYEPVWAIGTGRNAAPEQAQEVHAFLRGRIGAQDAKMAAPLVFSTAAASRPAMRRSCSRCPTWTADWSVALR